LATALRIDYGGQGIQMLQESGVYVEPHG